MVVENFFETEFYPNIKEYVEANSQYTPLILKTESLVSDVFPIVPIQLLNSSNTYTTLSYEETRYSFSIDISIYSQDKTIAGKKVSKKKICYEIADTIVKYLEGKYRLSMRIELDKDNVDSSVHRSIIHLTGVIDTTKGLDNLTIYPR